MAGRYWLFQRPGVFYIEDSITRKQESLSTRNRREAERIRDARNEAATQPFIGIALGRAYLAGHDPALVRRTWEDVMDYFASTGKEHTHARRVRAMRSRPSAHRGRLCAHFLANDGADG